MASSQQAEIRHLLPEGSPHRISMDGTLTADEPMGKLLFTFPLSTYFRPWVLGWSIVAAAFMMADADKSCVVFIVFTWLLFGWTIIATASHCLRPGNSHRKGFRLDFGAFVCICFGSSESGDGDNPGHSRRRWGQPLVDLAWAVTFFVLAPVVLRSHMLFYWGNRDTIIVSLFIIAVSQLVIAIIGFIPALQRLRLHLYKEESDDEGHYKIRLPQEPVLGKQAPMPVFP